MIAASIVTLVIGLSVYKRNQSLGAFIQDIATVMFLGGVIIWAWNELP